MVISFGNIGGDFFMIILMMWTISVVVVWWSFLIIFSVYSGGQYLQWCGDDVAHVKYNLIFGDNDDNNEKL